jgi:hypothetical protein
MSAGTELTVHDADKLMADHESRSMTVQLEGAPMLVRITLEFPKP